MAGSSGTQGCVQSTHTSLASPCSSEGDWGKLGILCDDWSQVTAVQGCPALPADTISAGSDEEESVLQQKHKGREGVLEYS